ncbi:hypothetical protein R9C00_04900 [Flammeovirgaceae bacterium SG7u.111]|nr:hypothetical protein [Flammeovirgaceae bacterium SG7u.132]WPO36782.1 hypothetical protein R9C00_04900 [Flammeovirgaceae bacterium SG7u.111]
MKHVRFLLLLFFLSCKPETELEKLGKHYQKNGDYQSLKQVVELMEMDVDTSFVKTILGEPISMGFDFRYLADSTSENGCTIGAVFHIGEAGKIDQKWIDEICE